MIARKQEIRLQLNQLIDAVLLGATFWACHELRFHHLIVMDSLTEIAPFEHFLWMVVVIMPFGPILLEQQGFYTYPLEKTSWKSLQQIARAGLWLVLFFGLAVIFLKVTVPSRSVLILFVVAAPGVLLLKERLVNWNHINRLKRGATGERILLAGEASKMKEILESFNPTQRLEIQVVESLDLESGDISLLVAALHRHNVGRVLLAFSRMELDKVQSAIEVCEIEGVEAWLSADFIRTSVAKPTYEILGSRPMLVFRATPELSWSMMIKNSIDRIGAAVGLILLSPLLAIIAMAIKMTSPGSAIFAQRRAGIHGHPFTMWKFRTMQTDAEQKLAELQDKNTMSGPVFKLDNDPRITPIGRWLRKTSLDELPQLFNVLMGQMSLVGPRPLPLYEVEKFQNTAPRRRLSMKPGLTCLWQIRGRNSVTNFDDWVRMDLEYIDHWSLQLDLTILFRTIPAVLGGSGAK